MPDNSMLFYQIPPVSKAKSRLSDADSILKNIKVKIFYEDGRSRGFAHVDFDIKPYITTSIGSVFLFALTFYITFLQQYEASLHRLPYSEKYKSMSLEVRSGLVTFFSSVGTFCYVVTPSLSQAFADYNPVKLLLSYQLPLGVFGIIFTVFCSVKQMHGTSLRVRAINEFTNDKRRRKNRRNTSI